MKQIPNHYNYMATEDGHIYSLLTPKQVEAARKAMIERYRCEICGADVINYSHTFDCPRRGTGF